MSKLTVLLHPQAKQALETFAPPLQTQIWQTIEQLQLKGTKTPQLAKLTGLNQMFMKPVPNHLNIVFTIADHQLKIVNVCQRDDTIANFFKQHGVQERFVQSLLEMAYAILREKHIDGAVQAPPTIRHDEASAWVSYEIHIPCAVDEVVDLTVELAQKFAETDLDSKLKDKVIVHYTSGLVN